MKKQILGILTCAVVAAGIFQGTGAVKTVNAAEEEMDQIVIGYMPNYASLNSELAAMNGIWQCRCRLHWAGCS